MKGAQGSENSGGSAGHWSDGATPADAPHSAPERIVITVPLPPRELSPNARVHWAKKAKATAAYREEVGWMALKQARREGWQTPEKARLTIIIGIRGGKGRFYQPRDEPNAWAALKAAIDGLVDAKVLIDDADKHLELGRITIARRGPAGVTFTVEVAG